LFQELTKPEAGAAAACVLVLNVFRAEAEAT
jgi:hypothetical protein